MNMIVRPVKPEETGRVAAIFEEAKKTIAALGIDQWQDGYPDKSIADSDARAGISYAVTVDGEIAGVCTLIPDGEPTYDVIEGGEWLTGNDNRRYMTVHRMAVAVAYRGSGAAACLLRFAAERAEASGLLSVRIDTHEGNAVMRRMLEKNGFVPCGIIHLANGDPRAAYEKRTGSTASGTEERHEKDSL